MYGKHARSTEFTDIEFADSKSSLVESVKAPTFWDSPAKRERVLDTLNTDKLSDESNSILFTWVKMANTSERFTTKSVTGRHAQVRTRCTVGRLRHGLMRLCRLRTFIDDR